MTVRLKYEAKKSFKDLNFGVAIHKPDGSYINGTNTYIKGIDTSRLKKKGSISLRYTPLLLLAGTYLVTVGVCSGDNMKDAPHDLHALKHKFKVITDERDDGAILLPSKWDLGAVQKR